MGHFTRRLIERRESEIMIDYLSNKYNYMLQNGDPRVAHLPLMENPILNTISVLLYLYIVKIAGPAFMKDRKPYEFRRILFIYNMVLVALSGWMFYELWQLDGGM